MGLLYPTFLEHPSLGLIYTCRVCHTHLLTSTDVISDEFRGRTGDAYLAKRVENVIEGEMEKRKMTTGVYIVKNISCHQCGNLIGWRYIRADLPDQRFKEGRYIIEINCMDVIEKDG